MGNNESRKIEKELKKISISLNKFLTLYCGISEESVVGRKMGHRDIKTLIPILKRTSLEAAYKNRNWLALGEVIIVVDSYGDVVPYIVPEIILPEGCLNLENMQHSEKLENIILDENLSRYELVLLCRYYKKNNRIEEYWVATRLLKKKKDSISVKAYKREKYNLRVKGREDYE